MRSGLPFCWDRLHHGYIGIVITIIGYLMKNNWIMIVGILVLLDDIIEHWVTGDTPLRIFYEQTLKENLPNCNECVCK